jgi:hypothetical protein
VTEAPQPAPPHLIVGIVIGGPIDASRAAARLEAIVRSRGAVLNPSETGRRALLDPTGEPLLIEVAFDDRASALVGLQLVVSGELLGMPSSVGLEPDETDRAEETRAFVRACFETSCRDLAVLYGGVDFEWRLRSPPELLKGAGRTPADLYWSSALDQRDPELGGALTKIYGITEMPFAHGTLLPGGGVLEPQCDVLSEPITAGRAAALRLSRVLLEVAQTGRTDARRNRPTRR